MPRSLKQTRKTTDTNRTPKDKGFATTISIGAYDTGR